MKLLPDHLCGQYNCLAALAVLYVHLHTSQFLHSNEQSPHIFSSKSIYHGKVKLGSSSFSSWRRKSSSNSPLLEKLFIGILSDDQIQWFKCRKRKALEQSRFWPSFPVQAKGKRLPEQHRTRISPRWREPGTACPRQPEPRLWFQQHFIFMLNHLAKDKWQLESSIEPEPESSEEPDVLLLKLANLN